MKTVMTPFGKMENHSTHPDAMGEEPDDLKHISQKTILEVKEQIQEDIITWIEGMEPLYIWHHNVEGVKDDLCQIVVDNFKRL